MTLVLGFMTSEGVGVVADTRFGSDRVVAAKAGPKIFSVPIILNRWREDAKDTEKRHLPNMGFAFAGNTFSGQTTHALASMCLQNLLTEEFDDGPSVADVAHLYARCAKLVVDERRQWIPTDVHCFEGVLFGRANPSAPSEAFAFEIHIGDDANAVYTIQQVDFSNCILLSLGAAEERVTALVRESLRSQERMLPWDILQKVIEDADVPSVDGHQQIAVSTQSGVELRPIFSSGKGKLTRMTVMGFDFADIGKIGVYWPASSHAAIG
jgi:hypothetical protein